MAPKKQWANPMRERQKYRQIEFNVYGKDYILEVPDGITTSVIMNNVKKNKPLYEKMSSLAKERGYDVDSDSPPMPLVSKEKYVELIRDAKIALNQGWRQADKIYIKNIVDVRNAPYAAIYPANKSGTIRKKCVRKKVGPPAAGDEPDDCDDDDDDDDDENPGKIPALEPKEEVVPPPAPSSSKNPYRTQYTDSMGRVSVTYIANDPKYKDRYAIDQYFNKVYFFDDHYKHDKDPLNHRPTQIGYIEGPGLPGSGERMDYMKAVNGETQKNFNISAGSTVYGGNFIYLLKPANKLVIMQDAIKAMEDEKERKEQAKHQAWIDSLTPVTYKGKKIYYEPVNERGTFELYDDTIEEGVYTNIGDYYPDSHRNPVFDEKKLENFGIQYTGYDTDSDASESVKSEKSSSNKGDYGDDYFDPHDDIPRFHPSEMVSTTAPAEPVAPPPIAPSETEHPPLPLPDGWRVRWSTSGNQWTFVDPTTGMQQQWPPGKSRDWRAYVSKTYNKWYYKNKRTGEYEWITSTGGKRSPQKSTRLRRNKKKTNIKKTRKSRTSKKTKKSRKDKKTKVVKITLRKIGKKNVRHHYTLNATSKKRHMAIAEGVNMEAKKTNRTRKQAAVAKKARLNVLRMYRKNNNPKQCNIITRDMEYMDHKYKLGKTVNICNK